MWPLCLSLKAGKYKDIQKIYPTFLFIAVSTGLLQILKKMKNKDNKLNPSESHIGKKKEDNLKGYPLYPKSEDIYEKFQEEKDISPEDTSKTKESNSTNDLRRKSLDDDFAEKDLDVPGAELDDAMEAIGSEDEENNYYSLGGDAHDDLEEDKENLNEVNP